MLCKNCGMQIPYAGKLCPFCQTDKADSKKLDTKVGLTGLAIATICAILLTFGAFTAAIGVFFVGMVVLGIMACVYVHGDKSTPTQTINRQNLAQTMVRQQTSTAAPTNSSRLKLKKRVEIATFELECPYCKSSLEGDTSMVGSTMQCPACGKTIGIE